LWWERFSGVELPFWALYERGGGCATKRAVWSWTDGIAPWSDKRALNDVKRYFEAGGAGVAVRILPHILFQADLQEFKPLADQIMLNGIVTHGHPRALVGALAHGYALWKSMRWTGRLDPGDLVGDLLDNTHQWSARPETTVKAPDWLKTACRHTTGFLDVWDIVVGEMVTILRTCWQWLYKNVPADDMDLLRHLRCFDKKIGGAGTITTGAAILLASRHAQEPLKGLAAAANAIGTDTATIASMTGGLLGAAHGETWLNPCQELVQDSNHLIRTAFNLVSKGGSAGQPAHPNVSRMILSNWVKEISKLRPGTPCALPDGRRGHVTARTLLSSKSGKFEVIFHKIASEDGQNLSIPRINRAPNQSQAG
jgi:hypothetical protein